MPVTAKRVKAWAAKLPPGKQFPLDDALKLVKELATAKFNESIDAAVNLGIDASKSDQQVRGSTVMPHGIGKAVRVAVFTSGKNQDVARAAGADIVGLEDLAEKVKAGQFRYGVAKAGIVHCTIGKSSFEFDKLRDKLLALIPDLQKAKPASSKGIYLKRVTLSSTMGPGVAVDSGTLGV